MPVKDNLRKIRSLRGYKQEYMASLLGISQQVYQKMESGQSKIDVELLRTIAGILNVSVEIFYREENLLENGGLKLAS